MTYIPLQNITLANPASSVTFASIPTSVNGVQIRDLFIVATVQRTGSPVNMAMRLNSDFSGSYANLFSYGDGSTVGGGALTANGMQMDSRSFPPSTGFNSYVIQVMDFSANNKQKIVINRADEQSGGTESWSYRWGNTTAVNTVTFSMGNFNTGSTFALYGIAG